MEMKQTEKKPIAAMAALLLIAGAAMLSSCEKYSFQVETINPGDSVHFQTVIQPIFTGNCILCHNSSRNPDLRENYSYNSLSSGGYINEPYSSSKLYTEVNGNHPSGLPETDRAKILAWILQGAKNN
jgi:hypothetical protein